jgi:hypothetical protein
MSELFLFLSAFVVVFSLGTQQLNVHGGHYVLAALTSLIIGASQIYLWHAAPSMNHSEIFATLAGGPVGIVTAMWAHPRLVQLLTRKSVR